MTFLYQSPSLNHIQTKSTEVSTAFSPEMCPLPSLLGTESVTLFESFKYSLKDGKSLSFESGFDF